MRSRWVRPASKLLKREFRCAFHQSSHCCLQSLVASTLTASSAPPDRAGWIGSPTHTSYSYDSSLLETLNQPSYLPPQSGMTGSAQEATHIPLFFLFSCLSFFAVLEITTTLNRATCATTFCLPLPTSRNNSLLSGSQNFISRVPTIGFAWREMTVAA